MSRHSIVTRSGLVVDLLAPEPAGIRLTDIALALSRIPRFNGHTSRVWSVADHSLLVLQLMGEDAPSTVRLAALLHDAHEAYAGDIISPVHVGLGALEGDAFAAVIEMKDRLDGAIETAFALPCGALLDSAIKAADQLALAIEVHALMEKPVGAWSLPALPDPMPDPMPMLPATDQMRAQNQFLMAALGLLQQIRGVRPMPAEAGAESAGG